jgi:putative toxin-antitoxin system antitoxin component (TIGR02293 family)
MAKKHRSVAEPPAPQYESAASTEAARHAIEAWQSPDAARRLELIRLIRGGFSLGLVDALAREAGVRLEELVEFEIIPRRTLAHSKRNERFTPIQSARLARFFRVQQKARHTFGSEDKAMQWLKRPTNPLNNNAPVAMLDTDEGARLVEDLLTRIDHGLAA